MVLALAALLTALPAAAMAAQPKFTLIQLKGTDVTLDSTVFQYTGEEIRPNVTVRVDDTLLTLDKDYSLSYADNIEVGTGKVIVTGIGTASETVGYTGTVEIPFEITAKAPAFTLIELKGTDVTIDGTSFSYTGSPIEPKVTVTVEGRELTAGKDYSVSYRSNIEVGTGTVIVSGIATASETLGYTGTVEIDFTITPPAPYELKGSDVTIEGTEFVYTGSYIEPKVTVTVDGEELTRDEDYTLTYHNNVGAGTATASVTGIESAGYTGQVNVDFTIVKDSQTPEFQLITLKGTDVELEGTKFTHTGKAIEPKVTVTVNGKVLTRGQDYSLVYENNINVGTGYAIVRGIATASETLGYTGEVKLPFTIVKAQEETEPTEPEATEPEATEPEATEPETVEYKITKGNKSTWYKESTKTLSFTVGGWLQDLEGVLIDGKTLPTKYFTTKGDTTVTLTNDFLQKLGTGKHTITIVFADGQAEGTFRVAEGLDTSNPETGDSIGLWITVMGLSAVSAAGLVVFRKKFF